MRVLVTGSRTMEDFAAISRELGELFTLNRGNPFIVVHGGAKGADNLAGQWARLMRDRGFDVITEIYPADWKTHGKNAGRIRNQRMVDLGADICLAFPRGVSRGTQDCINRAEMADIPVIYG